MPPALKMPVRFERTLNREVKTKDGRTVKYHHIRVRGLSEEIADALGWANGDELEAHVKGDSLILKRKKPDPKA